MDLKIIQQEFNLFLSTLKTEKESRKDALIKDFREDEAKHVSVELNIIDIFTKMFGISCQKALHAPEWKSALMSAYLEFFDKIPANWHTNLAKCKSFGKDEEAFIEELKIKQANYIKDNFIRLMNRS